MFSVTKLFSLYKNDVSDTTNIKSKVPNQKIPFLIPTLNYNSNPINLKENHEFSPELDTCSTKIDNTNIEIIDIQELQNTNKRFACESTCSRSPQSLLTSHPNSSKIKVMEVINSTSNSNKTSNRYFPSK